MLWHYCIWWCCVLRPGVAWKAMTFKSFYVGLILSGSTSCRYTFSVLVISSQLQYSQSIIALILHSSGKAPVMKITNISHDTKQLRSCFQSYRKDVNCPRRRATDHLLPSSFRSFICDVLNKTLSSRRS